MPDIIVVMLVIWLPVTYFFYRQARKIVTLIFQQRMVELLLEERIARRRWEPPGNVVGRIVPNLPGRATPP